MTIQSTNAVRAEGNVEAIDTAAETVTVLGVTFNLRASTQLEDDSTADVDPLALTDLGIGDEVEIRGFIDGMDVVATRLEREDLTDRASLRGPVAAEDAAAGTVEVLGVTLIGQDGVTEYQDEDDNVITAAQFHDLLEVGDFVEGDWDVFSDTNQVVDDLSIEDDD